ncbi:MAG: DUF2147 domain-containing protein [Hyphomicrobium sp.]
MRAVVLCLASLIAGLGLATTGAHAENLDGYWMDSHGEVIMQFGACGKERCGRVAWLKKPRGPDRGPLRDFRNPDAKLQSRFVCGLVVVSGFKKQPDGTWADGNVYVPDLGMNFSGYAEVLSQTKVKVSGYMLLPIFGSAEVWTRMPRKPPTCEDQAKMITEGKWSEDTSSWPPVPPPVASR